MAVDLNWIACDAVTGNIVQELPNIRVQGGLTRILNASTTAALVLPLDDVTQKKDWLNATTGGRTILVCQRPGDQQPLWGGLITRRRGGTSIDLSLAATTLEGYLDCRYIGDHTYTNQDQASVIAAGLLADAQVEGINFTIDAPASGQLRDRTYFDKDNKTVFRALVELAGVIDGIEFTVDLRWETPTKLGKVIQIKNRIGAIALNGTPSAIFSTANAGTLESSGQRQHAEYDLEEDWSNGHLANDVVAYSSGEGDSQPFSAHAREINAGWPRFEYRFEPSSSIKDVATLNSHAIKKVTETKEGSTTYSVNSRFVTTPKYGKDWFLGDDVGWNLTGPRNPLGVTGVGRAIGVDFDPNQDIIRPILWEP